MDPEEIQIEIDKLVNYLGPRGEELFLLAIALERIEIFKNLRMLIQQKEALNDEVAAAVLAWAWKALSDQ
jgi:hypothetical protein